MRHRYVAYGLEIQSSFPLPGMSESDATSLPAVSLRMLDPEELPDLATDPGWRSVWTGLLGDGHTLNIARHHERGTLFSYGDRARYLLDPSGERLDCAPLTPGAHWQQVLLGRILSNVAISRGYEALHASAVDSAAGTVAVVGPSGMGKTTLAVELLGRGWSLLTDDVMAFDSGPEGVRAHAGTPHMNLPPRLLDKVTSKHIAKSLGELAGEHWVTVGETAETPRPVRMVCLLERGPGLASQHESLAASPLPLAPYMLGLAGDAERERGRFTRYADLMSDAALIRLTGATTTPPTQFADRVEAALEELPASVARGVA